MFDISQYFQIDWDATGINLKKLLRERVSLEALAEWADRDVRTIRYWLNNPSMMKLEQLIVISKFLNVDLLSIIAF